MDPIDLSVESNAQLLVETLQMNMHLINKVRILMFIVGGIICGVMGLTSLNGLLMLLLTSIVTSLGFLFKLKFDIKKYTNVNFVSFTLSGISANAMSFVLFWTLSYAKLTPRIQTLRNKSDLHQVNAEDNVEIL